MLKHLKDRNLEDAQATTLEKVSNYEMLHKYQEKKYQKKKYQKNKYQKFNITPWSEKNRQEHLVFGRLTNHVCFSDKVVFFLVSKLNINLLYE